MKYCKLRIAWAAMCGMAFVLLCVLRARSYPRSEYIRAKVGRVVFSAASVRARLVTQVSFVPPSEAGLTITTNGEFNNFTAGTDAELSDMTNKLGFGYFFDPAPCVVDLIGLLHRPRSHWQSSLWYAGPIAPPPHAPNGDYAANVVLGLIVWNN